MVQSFVRSGPRLAASIFVLLLARPAIAAPDAPAENVYAGQFPDLVSALVVQAATPGPAWWRVTKGDSTLWILGTPPYGSISEGWDERPLRRRLAGANAFILPVYMETQPWRDTTKALPIILVRKGDPPPPPRSRQGFDGLGPPLVRDLPADLRTRVRKAEINWRLDTVSDSSSAIYTARWISRAMLERSSLSITALRDQLNFAARAAGVRTVTLPVDLENPTNAYINGPAEPKIACLEATLTQSESGRAPLGAAYRAWTVGDVPGALANVGCVGVKGAIYREETDMLLPLLEAALATPGKTVAGIELVPLLMKDGVIERLRTAGYSVEQPDSLDEL